MIAPRTDTRRWCGVPVDQVVAVAADHEGLAADLGHGPGPFGLRLAGLVEVGELADVMHLDAVRSPAELASSLGEPSDQLLVRVEGPGAQAVGEDRRLLPFERDAAEPCDQWFPALALDLRRQPAS